MGKSISVVAMARNVQGSQAEDGLATLEISTPWNSCSLRGFKDIKVAQDSRFIVLLVRVLQRDRANRMCVCVGEGDAWILRNYLTQLLWRLSGQAPGLAAQGRGARAALQSHGQSDGRIPSCSGEVSFMFQSGLHLLG